MLVDIACSCDLRGPLEELVMEIRGLATPEDDDPICIANAVWELCNEIINRNHIMSGELRCLRSLVRHQDADTDSPPLKRLREST